MPEKDSLFQRIVREFIPDDHFGVYIAHHNAMVGEKMGWGLAALELVLILGALARSSHLNALKLAAYVVMGAMSVVLALMSRRQLKTEGLDHAFVHFLACYLYVAVAYGISNSLQDFAEGKQIVTFYIFMMVVSCVFTAPPVGIMCLTVSAYVAIFLLGFSNGRMDTGSLVNFWISGVIVIVAGFVRFHESCVGAANELKLSEASLHDGLTGLRNRMALQKDFPDLLDRDQYVVMVDLDDFKIVNDSYGHEAGDIALKSYASALRYSFPRAELYRYGGDEFLFFALAEDAVNFDDRMLDVHRRMEHVEVGDGRSIAVGTSYGYVRGRASSIDVLKEQICQADGHLYEMKRANKAGRGMDGNRSA